jgi:diaminopimelate epimerase
VLLTKHHGLGNDFLVALHPVNPGMEVDADVARSLCDRRRGIGADGLIYGLPSDDADLAMVLINSDGSLAEISGNGLRCLGQAALMADGRAEGHLRIATGAGVRSLDVVPTDDPTVASVTADMGAVTEGPHVPDGVPVPPHAAAMGLGIGNPHVVFHVESLDGLDPAVVGPPIESAVPGGVNVHLLELEAPDAIRLAHWERGAGVTEACGSGASVSAVAARRWGLVGDHVVVRMPGGEATVDVFGHAGGGEVVRLTGPATYVGEVRVP